MGSDSLRAFVNNLVKPLQQGHTRKVIEFKNKLIFKLDLISTLGYVVISERDNLLVF
jgi:hypothetical protein